MKRLIYILFLFISVSLTAQTTYYVKPEGNDSNTGLDSTDANAWRTWGKAFNDSNVDPGDTVYFMGGVYYRDLDDGLSSWYYPSRTLGGSGYKLGRSGTDGNPVHYFAYPGETPILDNDNVVWPNTGHYVVRSAANYIHFKGLTIRNVWQINGDDEIITFQISGTGFIIEECVIYNTHGIGFKANVCDETYFINCDSYNNCDSLTTVPSSNPVPGNDGTGFLDFNWSDTSDIVYFQGCRAWNCGDQGLSSGSIGYTEYDSCWSWSNGQLEGGGHGFKMGWISSPGRSLNRLYKNCISAFNRQNGFNTNDGGYQSGALNVYNNISYYNGYIPYYSHTAYGFLVYNTLDDNASELQRVYRNNISYDNETAEVLIQSGASYTHSNNTWDSPITVTDADFTKALDSAGIYQELIAERQVDGSRPVLTYFQLASTSDLIDAGTDVDLPYNGSFPDIGAFEYTGGVSNIDVTSITISAAGGATTITVDDGTLQMSAVVAPANATFQNVTWSMINGTGTASISQSGLVTALTDGTVTVRATAQDGTGITDDYALTLSNQVTPLYPTVTTTIPASIFTGHLTSGGNVTDGGSTTITARGVCYGTSINPTLSGSYTTDGTGTGAYTSFISELIHGTRYYIRAYATNSVGTSYGDNRQVFTLSLPYRIYFNTNAYFLDGKVITTR